MLDVIVILAALCIILFVVTRNRMVSRIKQRVRQIVFDALSSNEISDKTLESYFPETLKMTPRRLKYIKKQYDTLFAEEVRKRIDAAHAMEMLVSFDNHRKTVREEAQELTGDSA